MSKVILTNTEGRINLVTEKEVSFSELPEMVKLIFASYTNIKSMEVKEDPESYEDENMEVVTTYHCKRYSPKEKYYFVRNSWLKQGYMEHMLYKLDLVEVKI